MDDQVLEGTPSPTHQHTLGCGWGGPKYQPNRWAGRGASISRVDRWGGGKYQPNKRVGGKNKPNRWVGCGGKYSRVGGWLGQGRVSIISRIAGWVGGMPLVELKNQHAFSLFFKISTPTSRIPRVDATDIDHLLARIFFMLCIFESTMLKKAQLQSRVRSFLAVV